MYSTPLMECCQVLISENFEFYQNFLLFLGQTAILAQKRGKNRQKIF
jgi:hypothetical protein